MQGSDAMKSLGKYISKHFASFAVFILIMMITNIIIFGVAFHKTFSQDYGENAPRAMLEMTASASTTAGLDTDATHKLRQNNIWAIYLNPDGESYWSMDLPEGVPESYTVQDVALFSKGYIKDYPVFVWSTDDGLLILGYPKDSYTKLVSNYYSMHLIQKLPFFVIGILALDLLLMFLAYIFSKRRIIQNTDPIVKAIESLSECKPVKLHVHGDLFDFAESVSKASLILSRQNEARANWISGVSHDIRTPLSMIMGYADRISIDDTAHEQVREQANIIRQQSIKIKELVQDLNLVSKLEYEMQPINREPVRLSKLLRSYVADLLNSTLTEPFSLDLEISPDAENIIFECDARLITRAINNIVQNSIRHNPKGCEIQIELNCTNEAILLTITDNGCGLSSEKMKELQTKPHYLNSVDERLDLRHGLGLVLVRKIVDAHNGKMQIISAPGKGCETMVELSR